MANPNFLDFQFKIMKRLPSRPKRFRWMSPKDRLDSSLSKTFQPKEEEMKWVFNKIDFDKDGKVSRNDLRKVVAALRTKGVGRCEDEAARMIEIADVDGDGFMNFAEFMNVHKGVGIKAVDIQRAFWSYDLDGDGKISAEDLFEMLSKLGESCCIEACRQMVKAVDSDGDGLVDMDDFVAMMTRTMNLIS